MEAEPGRPVLKVCGLTRVADMRCAEAAGADYCGCIVEIERSPRSITRGQAALLARACRAQPVLVVEGMPLDDLVEVGEAAHPAAVQLHGDAKPEYVRQLAQALEGRADIWRSIGLPAEAEDREAAVRDALAEIATAREAGAAAIVLDTTTPEGTGGTGQTCDWEAAVAIIAESELPVVLAGGLSPENLREAIEATHPAGVDLSSSLESAPGRKDRARLRQLAATWAEIR
jgi:phosphoribosylanthranilate isomerase